MSQYAEVAVLLPVEGSFHYSVPERLSARSLLGHRVLVPFGNRGVTGVVVGQGDDLPTEVHRVRPISALLDTENKVCTEVLALCRWMASYYEAPLGEVLRAALPPGTTVVADQTVALSQQGQDLTEDKERQLSRGLRGALAYLREHGGVAAHRDLTKARIRAVDIAQLVEMGYASYGLSTKKARVQDKTVRVARLVGDANQEQCDRLDKLPAKRALLAQLQKAGGTLDVPSLQQTNKGALGHLRTLRDWGLVAVEKRVIRTDAWQQSQKDLVAGMKVSSCALELNDAQKEAYAAAKKSMEAGTFAAFLLYGITGSGKTEVYLQIIAACLERGQNAIVLVPEISLTPQLAARFRARFGAQVAVLHSALTVRERYDEWHRLREGKARIALGARSAVFAPIDNVGVIVVDEEHDSSFKQDEGVSYHARDVALVRSQKANAICVLGSATPSLESFHGTQTGRVTLLPLPVRATGQPLPEVSLVDLRRFQPDKESMLTAPLTEAIEETLHAKDQVILFLNRRGFDTFVVCTSCGHAFRCGQCSVSLTYHRFRDTMMCHYCGHEEKLPSTCPSCRAERSIARRGVGTEKIADAVAKRFPSARVERLDRDVASGAAVQKILGRVARREVDILVGTQMVTKGHDFPGVTLVGVLCADTGLFLPDFRAGEKTFQLLTQVAGRAGRGEKLGRVVIQTYKCEAHAIATASQHDYMGFFAREMVEREELDYPPYGYLVAIRVVGANAGAVMKQCRHLADLGRRVSSAVSILGPAEAPLARLKGKTRWHLWLRAKDRRVLRSTLRAMIAQNTPVPGVRVVVDVDPISAL